MRSRLALSFLDCSTISVQKSRDLQQMLRSLFWHYGNVIQWACIPSPPVSSHSEPSTKSGSIHRHDVPRFLPPLLARTEVQYTEIPPLFLLPLLSNDHSPADLISYLAIHLQLHLHSRGNLDNDVVWQRPPPRDSRRETKATNIKQARHSSSNLLRRPV